MKFEDKTAAQHGRWCVTSECFYSWLCCYQLSDFREVSHKLFGHLSGLPFKTVAGSNKNMRKHFETIQGL